MAAGACKSTMIIALFAGTVSKGTGTRPKNTRAVKIQYFAQSAGNFSTLVEGSSETTRANPYSNFNAQFGKLTDNNGYFSVKGNTCSFQLILPSEGPVFSELVRRFGATFRHTPRGLL